DVDALDLDVELGIHAKALGQRRTSVGEAAVFVNGQEDVGRSTSVGDDDRPAAGRTVGGADVAVALSRGPFRHGDHPPTNCRYVPTLPCDGWNGKRVAERLMTTWDGMFH